MLLLDNFDSLKQACTFRGSSVIRGIKNDSNRSCMCYCLPQDPLTLILATENHFSHIDIPRIHDKGIFPYFCILYYKDQSKSYYSIVYIYIQLHPFLYTDNYIINKYFAHKFLEDKEIMIRFKVSR